MKRSLLVTILLVVSYFFSSNLTAQQLKDCKKFMKGVKEAYSQYDAEQLLPQCNAYLKIIPNNPVLFYSAARLNGLIYNGSLSLDFLRRAVELGYGYDMIGTGMDISTDMAFDFAKFMPQYQNILDKVRESERPIVKSTEAFTIKDRELAPEGIAYDNLEKIFYIGSMAKRKIIKVDAEGKASDFTKEMQDGLGEVLGITIDSERRELWACAVYDDTNATDEKNESFTGVFRYDLSTGKLINKYLLSQKDAKLEFNDLTLDASGNVYITESRQGNTYLISKERDKLEEFVGENEFVSPNGITFSKQTGKIYMADWPIGVYVIDPVTKEFKLLPQPKISSTYGIDGLYFYENSLVAVQNGIDRVARFYLNAEGDKIEKTEILEANNPVCDLPTTGAIAGDALYYLGNLSLKSYYKKEVVPDNERRDVTILKIDLKLSN